jgi:hypothetical protein
MLIVAIAKRKQLAVHITEDHFNALQKIKDETKLSNAKIIEMLIDSYNINTNISTNKEQTTNINTSDNINIIDEESILAKVDEKLARFTDISTVLNLIENELRDRGLIGIDYSECYDSPLPEDPSLAHLDEYNKPISQEELLKMIEDMEE